MIVLENLNVFTEIISTNSDILINFQSVPVVRYFREYKSNDDKCVTDFLNAILGVKYGPFHFKYLFY